MPWQLMAAHTRTTEGTCCKDAAAGVAAEAAVGAEGTAAVVDGIVCQIDEGNAAADSDAEAAVGQRALLSQRLAAQHTKMGEGTCSSGFRCCGQHGGGRGPCHGSW